MLGVLGVTVAVTVLLTQATRVFPLSGQTEATVFDRIEMIIGYAPWVTIPTALVILVWRGASVLREYRLRQQFPDADVLPGVGNPELSNQLARLRGSRFHIHSVASFPVSFSLVVDSSVLSIWAGVVEPDELFRFPRAQVESLRFVNVRELGRSSRGLELTVVHNDITIVLPIIVTGRGPAGLFPEAQSRLDLVIDKFTSAGGASR